MTDRFVKMVVEISSTGEIQIYDPVSNSYKTNVNIIASMPADVIENLICKSLNIPLIAKVKLKSIECEK